MSGKGSSKKTKKRKPSKKPSKKPPKKPDAKKTVKPSDPFDLSERMRKFGEKVNLFIDELRTTGETVFPDDNKGSTLEKNQDEIVDSLIDSHVGDDLDLVTESDNLQLENEILELMNEIKEGKAENSELKQEIIKLQLQVQAVEAHDDVNELKAENSELKSDIEKLQNQLQTEEEFKDISQVKVENSELKQEIADLQLQLHTITELGGTEEINELKEKNSELKKEIVKLQLELHTIAEHGDIIEKLTVEDIPNEDDVHEIKEIGILNFYNPEHWDRLLQMNYENYLTLPILEMLHAEEEIQLIIVALKLEADPSDCLSVVKGLQDIGVVDLGYKTHGGLNPLVTLIKHF